MQPSRRRLWRGFGLDSALIAAVALFALALGLLPIKKTEPPAPEPAAAATPTPVRPAVKRMFKPPPAPAATPAKPAAEKPKPAQPPRDKYESLRQAWGD
jgi:outer membrane biosynthesis protein TonB